MRSIAGLALGLAASFFAVVAVLLNAPVMFYIGTGLIATIGASRLQAWLSVRALRFDRVAPNQVRVGDLVTVQISVWSERRVKRPLVTVVDNLPARLPVADRSPSLPIAPAFDVPILTQYRFRPLKRGVYRWSGLSVVGTDALGLVMMGKHYPTPPVEMVVLPKPIPVALDIPLATGWGISEAESGQARGAGIEPRGVREYAVGDSLRHVHWASSARRGQLLVKEFEAGSHTSAAFVLQRTSGSEFGSAEHTTLEMMCGHAAFLADTLLQQGAKVEFPVLEEAKRHGTSSERLEEILQTLAHVQADTKETVADDVASSIGQLRPGSLLFVMLSLADPGLPSVLQQLRARTIQAVVMVYDAKTFEPKRRFADIDLASNPSFLEQLEGAGAHVRVLDMEQSAP
jgi:uncharacterized protein (DUF58 family)